jgi:hypothetical protein
VGKLNRKRVLAEPIEITTTARSSACERVGSHASRAQIAHSGAASNVTSTTAIEHRSSPRRAPGTGWMIALS